MNEKNFAERIELGPTKLNVLEDFLDALKQRAWEIEPAAEQLLRESRTLLIPPSGEDFVFRTPFSKLDFEGMEIRADQVARFPADPPTPQHTEYPCWPRLLLRLCLDLSDKLDEEMLYVSTRTRRSGIDEVALFEIQSVLNVPVLSLVSPDRMITKDEKNYLIHS